MREEIKKTVEALSRVSTDQALRCAHTCPPPDRQEVVKVIHDLQALLFPLVYRREYPDMADETLLSQALYRLRDQLAAALRCDQPREGEAEENADSIGELIDTCLTSPELKAGIRKAREASWEHIGESASRTVDYLMEKAAIRP